MNKFFIGIVVATIIFVAILAAGMVVFIENNGWSYSIHKLPVIGHVLFNESGVYCTPSHCIEVITYQDSTDNPDVDMYWDEPEFNIWAHYMY